MNRRTKQAVALLATATVATLTWPGPSSADDTGPDTTLTGFAASLTASPIRIQVFDQGIPGPVEIFRLIGLKPAVNSEHFRGASLMPLRGREAELETLQRALLDTSPGSSQTGKSRNTCHTTALKS